MNGFGIDHARNHGYGDVATSTNNQHTGTGDVIPIAFVPVNYAAGGGTLGDHLSGIDTVLGTFLTALPDHGHTAPTDGGRLGGAGVYAVGDLIYASAASTLTRLSVGAAPDGFVVKLAGGVPTWAADATGAAGNTLDDAYDQGGPGAGRTITASDGAVQILDIPTAGGSFLDIGYSGAISPTGTHTGVNIDFDTGINAVPGTTHTMVGYTVATNTLLINSATTVIYRGYYVDGDSGAGAFQVSNAGGAGLWQGLLVEMPSDMSQSAGTLNGYGLHIIGPSTATGAPTLQGLRLEMPSHDAIFVTAGDTTLAHTVTFTDGNWTTTIDPTASDYIGMVAAIFNTGRVINFGYGSPETQVGDLVGVNMNFQTNLTAVNAVDIDGYIINFPGLVHTSGTNGHTGLTVGGLAGSVSGTGLGQWRGVFITVPDVTQTGSASAIYDGISIIGGTLTGSFATGAGVRVDMAADADDAIRIVQGTIRSAGNVVLFGVTPNLDFLSTGSTITMIDNDAAPLAIQEGANVYLRFVTTDGSESIDVGEDITFLAAAGVNIIGNSADALDIQEGTNVYQRFVTTNGSEAVQINPGNLDIDFLVNGDTNSNLIVTDGANNRVGFGGTAADVSVNIDPATYTAGVGASAAGVEITGSITEAASGTHAYLAGVNIAAADFSSGGASTTVAVTFRIAGPAGGTITTPGIVYALQVVSGLSGFGGGMQYGVTTLTGPVTQAMGVGQHINEITAAGGNVVVNLPTITSLIIGREYEFKRIDSSANTVTINRGGSDTIDGVTSTQLTTQYQSLRLIATALTRWSVL